MARVTVTGPNDPTEIHKVGCKDLDNRRKFREPTWTVEVASLTELAIEIWGDVAGDELTPESPEWVAQCEEWLASEYRIMPCAPNLSPKLTKAQAAHKLAGDVIYDDDGEDSECKRSASKR